MKYAVKLYYLNGITSIIETRNRTQWCKRIATKHMHDVMRKAWFLKECSGIKLIEV